MPLEGAGNEAVKVVDLFCGAGGFSLGFALEEASIEAAVDNDPIHLGVHEKNFPSTSHFELDLSQLPLDGPSDLNLEGEPDVVVGGPPCQGFSVMGNQDPEDDRNDLLVSFARAVDAISPSYFIMENVPGLLAERNEHIMKQFVDVVEEAGYSFVEPVRTVNAKEYGVPQDRERVFFLGYKEGEEKPEYPDPGYPIFGLKENPTCDDALLGLPTMEDRENPLSNSVPKPDLDGGSTYIRTINAADRSLPKEWRLNGTLSGMSVSDHRDETISRFSETEQGEYEDVSRFYRLEGEGLCPTLRAGTGPSRGSFMAARPIHPLEDRCITVREAARLHSFPDWFEFHDTKWHSLRQIGNSVPPLLARAFSKTIPPRTEIDA